MLSIFKMMLVFLPDVFFLTSESSFCVFSGWFSSISLMQLLQKKRKLKVHVVYFPDATSSNMLIIFPPVFFFCFSCLLKEGHKNKNHSYQHHDKNARHGSGPTPSLKNVSFGKSEGQAANTSTCRAEIRSGQVRSGQVRSGQDRSGQVRSCQEMWFRKIIIIYRSTTALHNATPHQSIKHEGPHHTQHTTHHAPRPTAPTTLHLMFCLSSSRKKELNDNNYKKSFYCGT